jgi:hypothetical protein
MLDAAFENCIPPVQSSVSVVGGKLKATAPRAYDTYPTTTVQLICLHRTAF